MSYVSSMSHSPPKTQRSAESLPLTTHHSKSSPSCFCPELEKQVNDRYRDVATAILGLNYL
jgi:hypothetical protein